MDQDQREKQIHQIRIWEQLEEWETMFRCLDGLSEFLEDSHEEQAFPSLLASCNSHRLGNLRTAVQRVKDRFEQFEQEEGRAKYNWAAIKTDGTIFVQKYVSGLIKEMIDKAEATVALVKNVESKVVTPEGKTVYELIIADCYRYICDASLKNDHEQHQHYIGLAESAYETARSSAAALPTSNSTRLRTMNQYAIFYYEHKGDVLRAFEVCEKEYEASFDELSHRPNAEANLYHQMLKDNMICWQLDEERLFSTKVH